MKANEAPAKLVFWLIHQAFFAKLNGVPKEIEYTNQELMRLTEIVFPGYQRQDFAYLTLGYMAKDELIPELKRQFPVLAEADPKKAKVVDFESFNRWREEVLTGMPENLKIKAKLIKPTHAEAVPAAA